MIIEVMLELLTPLELKYYCIDFLMKITKTLFLEQSI